MRIERSEKSNIYSMLLMLFFVIVIYVLAEFVVIRDLDKNIELKSRLDLQQTIMKFMRENERRLKEELAPYSSLSEYYDTLHKSVELVPLLQNYFTKIDVEKLYEKSEDGLKKERYVVVAMMQTPKRFFSLLEDIGRLHLPLRIDMPVKFTKRGDEIEVSFFVELYRAPK